ncbi:unnamed protein product [Linum tenue]|uniref:Uncharacterized protein n=1 Tax=Linum tenue TaxID=586396 RepID=A0AAV0NEA4_9ROSI|nr:unnamed protein product [Linum tenue]
MHVQFVVSLFATIFCTVPMVVNRDFEALSGEAGLVTSLLVPVQQVFAVIFLREGFNAEKALALALCLWGFASHLYGGYKASLKKKKKNDDVEDYGDDEQGAKSSGDHA